MSYEEFQSAFLDHIEGRASNKRYRSGSAQDDDGEGKQKSKLSATKVSNLDEEEE